MRSEGYTSQGGAAEAGRSGSEVQVWGWLSVWLPQIGVRESRDVTLYEGTASVLPDDGSTAEVQDVDLQIRRRPTPHLRRTTQRVSGTATMRGQHRRRGGTCTSCTHPRAVKPVPSLTEDLADDIPASLAGIRATNSFRTWGNFTWPSLVRRAGGRGALLVFGASEKPGPVFRPTPSAPDPQTIQDARDATKWRAAMNIEIENMRHVRVFTAVPRPLNTTIIRHVEFSTGTSRMAHSSSTRYA